MRKAPLSGVLVSLAPREHRARLEEAVDRMSKPQVFLLKVFSDGLSVTALKKALKLLSYGWRVSSVAR